MHGGSVNENAMGKEVTMKNTFEDATFRKG